MVPLVPMVPLAAEIVQGFLVIIGKNGTNSTIGRFTDFTIGRTPNQRYILYRDLKLLLNIDICPRYDCRSGRQVNRGKKSMFLSAAESVLKVRILAKIYC